LHHKIYLLFEEENGDLHIHIYGN